MKKTIITIAGSPGSGKSKTGKEVAEKLGFSHASSGDFARGLASKFGMTISDLTVKAREDKSIIYDDLVDQWVRDQNEKEKLVLDSRLAFHWIPDSFKVYLQINPQVAATRMFADLAENSDRKKNENYETVSEMEKKMIERLEADRAGYIEKYNVDYTDLSQYDLIIDTGLPENNLQKVVDIIIEEYKKWAEISNI